MPPAKIIIDTDPAIGLALRDIDDALAILYLLGLPREFDVLGLTVVAGNCSVREGVRAAGGILSAVSRRDLPVFPGSPGRGHRAGTPAAAFLARTAAAHPGEVTVLAIGPLSNVAAAGLLDPGFYGNVSRIVMMGGAFSSSPFGPLPPAFEFNFFKDPAAARGVLAAPCRKVLLTADLCSQVVFTRREVDAVRSMGSPAARYLSEHLERWYRVNHVAPTPWKGGFIPWDAVAAVYLRKPGLFAERRLEVRLRPGRPGTGALELAGDGRPSRAARGEAGRGGHFPCLLPESVDARGLLEEFLSVIEGSGRPAA